MAENILGLELSGAVESAVAELKTEVANSNVLTVDTDEGFVIYPLNAEAVDLLADYSSELGQDVTSVRIVIVTPEGQVIQNGALNASFADTLNSTLSWFELRYTSAIHNFLVDGIADGTLVGATLELPEPEAEAETEFSDDMADEALTVASDADPDGDTFVDDDTFIDDGVGDVPEEPVDAPVLETKTVELPASVQEAIDLADLPELPIVDPVVNARMQVEYMDARSRVDRAHRDLLTRMVDKRQSKYDAVATDTRENKLHDAEQAHNETLARIADNLTADEASLQQARDEQYQNEKDIARQAMLEAWEKQYDIDHVDAFERETDEQKANLQDEANRAEADENANYETFVAETVHALAESEADAVDYEPELHTYRQVVQAETDRLLARAHELEQGDVQAIREAQAKQAEAEARFDALQSQLDVIKSTQDETVNAQVTRKVSDITVASNTQIAELQARVKDLTDELQAERGKSLSLVRDVDSLNRQLSETQRYVTNVPTGAQASLTPSDTPEEPDNEELPVEEERVARRKWVPWAITAGVAVAFAGAGWSLGHHTNQTPVATQSSSQQSVTHETSTSAVESQSSEANQSETATSQTVVAGTELPVTLKDGSVVNVTADTNTSGHYTDSDGNKHTIYFTR